METNIIGQDCQISTNPGQFNVIGDNCAIGEKTVLGAQNTVYKNVKIGRECFIGSHCVIEPGAEIDDHVFIGNNVFIASGVTIEEGSKIKSGAVIKSNVGFNSEIGQNCIIERDVYLASEAKIGVGVHLQRNSWISHNVTIEDYCVVITNSVIGCYAKIGPMSLVNADIPPFACYEKDRVCGCYKELVEKTFCGLDYKKVEQMISMILKLPAYPSKEPTNKKDQMKVKKILEICALLDKVANSINGNPEIGKEMTDYILSPRYGMAISR